MHIVKAKHSFSGLNKNTDSHISISAGQDILVIQQSEDRLKHLILSDNGFAWVRSYCLRIKCKFENGDYSPITLKRVNKPTLLR